MDNNWNNIYMNDQNNAQQYMQNGNMQYDTQQSWANMQMQAASATYYKKCPTCKNINYAQSWYCGMCNTNISSSKVLTYEQAYFPRLSHVTQGTLVTWFFLFVSFIGCLLPFYFVENINTRQTISLGNLFEADAENAYFMVFAIILLAALTYIRRPIVVICIELMLVMSVVDIKNEYENQVGEYWVLGTSIGYVVLYIGMVGTIIAAAVIFKENLDYKKENKLRGK